MEATQLWQAALNVLQQQVARKEFDTWLKTSAIADFDDGVVVVAMPNTFAVEWVENRTKPLIERTLSEIVGYPVGVRFVVRQGGGYFTPATAADRASAMALGAAPGAGYLDETSAATALAAGARLATGDAGVSLFAEDGIASSMPQRSAMVQTPDTQPRSGYLDGNGRSYRPRCGAATKPHRRVAALSGPHPARDRHAGRADDGRVHAAQSQICVRALYCRSQQPHGACREHGRGRKAGPRL